MVEKKQLTWQTVLTNGYAVALLTLLPLWTGPGGYTTIHQDKFQVFWWVTALYWAILAVGAVTAKSFPQTRWSDRKILWCLLGFLGAVTLSGVLSQYPNTAFGWGSEVESVWSFWAYGLVFLAIATNGTLSRWYILPLVAGVLGNGILIGLQIQGQNPLGLFPQGLSYLDANVGYTGVFLGTLGNAGVTGAYLAMAVGALGGCFLVWKEQKAYWLLLPFAVGVWALKSCQVSAPWVGLGCGFCLLAPWLISPKGTLAKGLLVMAIGLGIWNPWLALPLILLAIFTRCLGPISPKIVGLSLLALIAGGLLLLYVLPSCPGTIGEIQAGLHGELSPTMGSSRVEIWANAANLVPEHWLFGGGPGTLVHRYVQPIAKYHQDIQVVVPAVVDTAHNDFLNLLVNTGLLGLMTYLLFLARVAKAAWDIKNHPATIVAGIFLLTYLGQVCFSFANWGTTPLFWLALGGLVAYSQKAST